VAANFFLNAFKGDPVDLTEIHFDQRGKDFYQKSIKFEYYGEKDYLPDVNLA